MELIRRNESTSINFCLNGLTSAQNYFLYYDDTITGSSYSASATADIDGKATFFLDPYYLKYNGFLYGQVLNSSSVVIYETNIDVVRPYCNITKVGLKLELTYEETKELEKVARYMIDSQTSPFTYLKKYKEVTGGGYDYIPIDERIIKIYKVYENNILVYNVDGDPEYWEGVYRISTDKTSIIVDNTTITAPGVNRMNYPSVWRDRFLDVDFPDGYEYLIQADFGWQTVPQDIQEACEILIQDLSKGNLRYATRYIESFDNEDFKIKFQKDYSTTTGNMVVDKILSKYKTFIKIGVL
jgi:hypothetical protein